MEASGQLLRWRPARCVARWRRTFRVRFRILCDAFAHSAAVGFQLRFALTAAHPDAAFLARQVSPEFREARQQMLQLREFNLHLAFARAGALREDVENQRRAVQNFAPEDFFKVAALRGRKFVVENHRVHIVRLAEFCKFLRLALADESRGVERFHFLNPVAGDFAAGGDARVRQVRRANRGVPRGRAT